MKNSTLLVVLVLIGIVAIAGCTSANSPSSTSSGASTPASGTQSASSTLTTSPTDVMPADIAVTVTVGEKDYLGNIPVTFNGGPGQINVHSIQVVLTRVDGTTDTESLTSNQGSTVTLAGTRGSGSLAGQSDRVQVYVSMNNGITYKIADELRQYRSRSGSGE